MAKSDAGDRALRRDGGYSEGGHDQSGGGNPHLSDISGPKDRQSFNSGKASKGMTLDSYKSPENQKGGSFSSIDDTPSSADSDCNLMRSTPGVGVYQAEGQNRGGPATKNCDSSVDSDLEVRKSWRAELHAKQDRAVGRNKNEGKR